MTLKRTFSSTAAIDELDYADVLTSGEGILDRRKVANTGVAQNSSGSVRLTYFRARKTETITQVKSITGGTAAGATPTLCKMGIFSEATNGDLTLVVATASDTALWAASNTAYTRSFTGSFSKVKGQRYAYATIVVTAAALPTFQGGPASLLAAEMFVAPRLTAVLTGQTDLPSSIATGSLAASSSGPMYASLLP